MYTCVAVCPNKLEKFTLRKASGPTWNRTPHSQHVQNTRVLAASVIWALNNVKLYGKGQISVHDQRWRNERMCISESVSCYCFVVFFFYLAAFRFFSIILKKIKVFEALLMSLNTTISENHHFPHPAYLCLLMGAQNEEFNHFHLKRKGHHLLLPIPKLTCIRAKSGFGVIVVPTNQYFLGIPVFFYIDRTTSHKLRLLVSVVSRAVLVISEWQLWSIMA